MSREIIEKTFAENGTIEKLSDAQMRLGYDFLGDEPPSFGQFNFIQQQAWQGLQYLLGRSDVHAGSIAGKVNKEAGKGLSSNDFSNDDKATLDALATGAVIESRPIDSANNAILTGTYYTSGDVPTEEEYKVDVIVTDTQIIQTATKGDGVIWTRSFAIGTTEFPEFKVEVSAEKVIYDGISQSIINNSKISSVESIADLKNIKNPKIGLFVNVKSYIAGKGFGGGLFAFMSGALPINDVLTFEPENGGNGYWQRIIQDQNTFDATWGGAVPDGVTNCTGAIQRVIDIMPAWKSLSFPNGTYICNTLKMKTMGVSWRGQDMLGTTIKFLQPTDCIKIMQECVIEKMRIWGTGVYTHDALIVDEKGHNRADVDITLRNCYLSEAAFMLRIYGRGVIFDSCVSYNIRYAWLDLQFPAAEIFEPNAGNNGGLKQAMRGYVFRNNRNHYSPCYFVDNHGWNSENARGFLFVGNHLEGGTRFVIGAIREALVSGNISYHRTAGWKYFECTTVEDLVITGNTFHQFKDVDYPDIPDTAEFISVIGYTRNLIITNNSFSGIGKSLCRLGSDGGASIQNGGIIIRNNTYSRCFSSGASLVELQSGNWANIQITESLIAPNATWLPVKRAAGLVATECKVDVYAKGSPFVHNFSRANSLGSSYKSGVYTGSGDAVIQKITIGYEPRSLKVYGSDGTFCAAIYGTASLQNGVTVNSDGTFSATANANKLGVTYSYESF